MIKLIHSLIALIVFIESVKAGCFLNYYSEDCKYRYFYDFGPIAGDQNLSKFDDHYILLQKPVKFKFYEAYFSAFYISTNGVIKLIENNETFNLHESYNYNSELFPIVNETLIAPFWTDMIPDSKGDVFYRITTDNETLNSLSFEIDRFKPSSSSFKPSWAAVITWFQLKAFNHRRYEFNNTFQLVLTTDGIRSYVVYNYDHLSWPNNKIQVNVVTGYNLGNNQSYFQTENSFSQNITELQRTSNVGVPSKWIFRVDTNETKQKSSYLEYFISIQKEKTGNVYYSILFIIIFIILTVVNLSTVICIRKYMKGYRNRPRLQIAYNKQLNDSSLILNQDQDV